MPASLNCQYSNSRNVEFLYSSNVANPCSVDMATTTMPLLIALFGSLVYDEMKCQLKPIPVSMTDEELSLPWQQKNGICLLCCVCVSLQVSSRLSVLLAGNVNIGMKTIDYDLFELGRHTVMLMTSDAMLPIYRSVPLIHPSILYTTSSLKWGEGLYSNMQLVSNISPPPPPKKKKFYAIAI